MKLILQQDDETEIPEILIKYKIIDSHLKNIIAYIDEQGKTIVGQNMERNVEVILSVSDIYYIETVDKKTFINMEKDVFENRERLSCLLDQLTPFRFCQINRSCILNTRKLTKVEVLANSRLKGYLDNGENIGHAVNLLFKYTIKINDR